MTIDLTGRERGRERESGSGSGIFSYHDNPTVFIFLGCSRDMFS